MKLACGLAAALAVAFVHAAPLTALRLVALSNAGNQELTLPLAATDAATGEGMLGTTYAAQWTREGPRLALHVTRKDDGAYWRLALQATFAPACETLKIGYGSLPVALPLKRITKPGQCYWFWENGRPDWIAATGPDGASALVPETATHHGFFLIRQPDGSTLAQFALDAWKPGDSTDIAVRLGDETALPQASREAPPGKNRLGSGFIRVGSDGHGFVTPAGQP